MVVNLFESLLISAFLLGIILLVLLFVMIIRPPAKKTVVRKKVAHDLDKIKNQVNGKD